MHPLEIWMATWNNKLDNYCQIMGSLILYSCKIYLPHCLTKTQPINFTSSFLQLVTLHWKCWKSSSNDCHFGRLKNDYLKIISLVAQIFQNAISRYFNWTWHFGFQSPCWERYKEYYTSRCIGDIRFSICFSWRNPVILTTP